MPRHSRRLGYILENSRSKSAKEVNIISFHSRDVKKVMKVSQICETQTAQNSMVDAHLPFYQLIEVTDFPRHARSRGLNKINLFEKE